MSFAQSKSSYASPGSHNSAKHSHHSQWTYQDPSTPTATPYISCIPLPHTAKPKFVEDQAYYPNNSYSGHHPAAGSPYYTPSTPSLPPVPLPHPNQPSLHYSSSSSRSIHSSHSSHTSSSAPSTLHPFLIPQNIQLLLSPHPFRQDMLCVPQNLKYNINEEAFHPSSKYMEVQLPGNNLAVQSASPLTVDFILRSLYEHLRCPVTRDQWNAAAPEMKAVAVNSFEARCAQGRSVRQHGIMTIDFSGFGGKAMMFVGLKPGNGGHEWIPVFQPARS
ncbi:hypothetical protein C8R47DRAFT_1065256 [Mycena vitilis]|nr:hypothetical protein C8R47DRAFT_1065256 [Mycena vitilis]